MFGGGAKAAEHFDSRGKRGETLLERFKMLESEDRGGREDGDLLVVGNGFEGGAHGDFGFAVANVSAEEAIHRGRFFQIALDIANRSELVGSFLKLERVFKFALPVAVGRERKALGGFALRVKKQELVRHVFEGFADAGFARSPRCAAQAIELRLGTFDDAIALDQIHAFERNVESRVIGKTQQHELAATAVGFDEAKPFELADAVINVDDVVAGFGVKDAVAPLGKPATLSVTWLLKPPTGVIVIP